MFLEPLLVADDSVSRRLIEQDYSLRRERLNPKPYSRWIGQRIDEFEGASIVFRIEGNDLLLIRYELATVHRGLRNPFRGFVRFLDWLVLEELGIENVYGAIAQINAGLDRRLTKDRIATFYKRILCGQTMKWEDGTEWNYTPMSRWREFRAHRTAKGRN